MTDSGGMSSLDTDRFMGLVFVPHKSALRAARAMMLAEETTTRESRGEWGVGLDREGRGYAVQMGRRRHSDITERKAKRERTGGRCEAR
jgi:hypothetical protein